ncbi:hypothetical protein [Acinetobacter terrae]|uniref:hypothetical protein n=1 Tax=Acinetobacter terrae TaxID=2731247 RepID=UPI0007D839EF|nr:hypothetical protein [Acinetobacter terrae]OAL80337.1 hypothetical protein AY608_05530 [Acinetobacter terrae]OTG73407.1 hypothetical protein B9T23_13730 [Acinetobacter terrae]
MGIKSSTEINDSTNIFKDFKIEKLTPEQEEKQLKEMFNEVKINSIASDIAKFLYSAKAKIDVLEYKVGEKNKGKSPRHDDLISYRDIVKKEIESNLRVQENFELDNFKEEYTQNSYDRVKEKLKNLNNAELLLGFEFILDELIHERAYKYHIKQFEEKVDLEDLFDAEAISNIENHLSR